MKFYAVKVGRNKKPMIFTNWNDCKSEVDGISGAIYKSFSTLEDAKEFINCNTNTNSNTNNNIINIYVDGSYCNSIDNYSYAFVVVKNDEILYSENGIGQVESAKKHKNVSGELLATYKSIKYANLKGYKKIVIYYDYQGISAWADGTWKAKNEASEFYRDIVKKYRKAMSIDFVKVKSHTGNKFNEIADKLAKEAFIN